MENCWNISSRSGDMPQTSQAAYGAGKAALNMATRNLALSLEADF